MNRKKLLEQVENMVAHFSVNILILAEVAFPIAELLEKKALEGFEELLPSNNKVRILTTLGADNFSLLATDNRYAIWKFNQNDIEELLFVALHMPSKMNLTCEQQAMEVAALSGVLAKIEQELGIEKTMVLGDFNMNPFDFGMVSHAGFNAVMSRKIAQKGKRMFQGRAYSYFYNPMWGLMGDFHSSVPGTFYRNGDYNWNLFDQMLIRKPLFKNFDPMELEIVVSDGINSFLSKSGMLNSKFSDHLPIKFTLNL